MANSVVPVTDRAFRPVTAPLNTASPSTVRFWLPPVIAANVTVVPLVVVAARSVTASPYVCVPVVVRAPVSVVLPAASVERSLIPVNVAPSIAVVPLKFSTRFLLAPTTPAVNVGVVPASVTVAAPSVTRPV